MRRMLWAGDVARMREIENAHKILVGRSRQGWEDNLRMDLRETGWKGVNWIHLAQDRSCDGLL
jgi:hypothetical protein